MVVLRLLVLVVLLTALPVAPGYGAQGTPAGAASSQKAHSTQQTVDALLALLDGSGKRSRMDSLDALRKAGFSYEKHLVVPGDVDLSCKSRDERAVVAGMRSMDWDYAVFFGQPAEQGRVCILPYTKGHRRIDSPPLQEKEWVSIQTDPASPEAREILLRRSVDFQRKMLQESRKNPDALEALGARLYGATLESLYITTILVLAAEESDSLEYLKKLQAGNFARQNKIFDVLLRNRQLGSQEYFRERAALVTRVQQLLEKRQGRPRLKDLAAVVEIIQPERDHFLAPCVR